MNDGRRKGEWLEWTLPHGQEASAALDELKARMGLPPRFWTKLEQAGGLQTNGPRLRLRLFPKEPLQHMPAWAGTDILFEDDFCLVANKPAGMKVHPTEQGESGTLLEAVSWHVLAAGDECRPRHIHRLDEDTTGPVLFAKHDFAQARLDAAMREKRIGRTYIALAHGLVEAERGTIDAPIGRDRHHPVRRRVSPSGEPAQTYYETVERYLEATLVRLRLATGRTHQIRVHMSHLGHPLLGDALYGGQTRLFRRQALHGERLAFPHPWSGEETEVFAPWPAELAALAAALQK